MQQATPVTSTTTHILNTPRHLKALENIPAADGVMGIVDVNDDVGVAVATSVVVCDNVAAQKRTGGIACAVRGVLSAKVTVLVEPILPLLPALVSTVDLLGLASSNSP